MRHPLRILIADDHEMVREGLKSVLSASGKWAVCGEAADGREAVRLSAKHCPHVVIMDLSMPHMGGLEATRRIVKDRPETQVLILSMHESEQLMHEVLQSGARGYVLKSDAGGVLLDALEHLTQGRPYFSAAVSEFMLSAYGKPAGAAPLQDGPAQVLTPREREIVQLIGEGRTSKEIAEVLDISVKTAETHRSNLMRKIGVHSVSEVVRYAIRNNMVAP